MTVLPDRRPGVRPGAGPDPARACTTRKDPVEQHDLERIARATLKELGLAPTDVTIVPAGPPGQWRLEVRGIRAGPSSVSIKCGQGTTAQWVREQIFNQYSG